MSFIKSADTSVPVANSRAEIEKILRRYGASGFSVQQTFDDRNLPEKVVVSFVVPDTVGSTRKVPVSIPISVKHVYDALNGQPFTSRWDSDNRRSVRTFNPKGYNEKLMVHAERVAWRNLVLWIDAALAAAAVRLQTITEAFYAHTVVQLEGGGTARMADVVERMQGQLPPGVRALLATPAEVDG